MGLHGQDSLHAFDIRHTIYNRQEEVYIVAKAIDQKTLSGVWTHIAIKVQS